MGLFPDIDFMFNHEGFKWDEQANAWRHIGSDPHLPGTTMFTFVRPAYVTISMTNAPDDNETNWLSNAARQQLDRYFHPELTKGKMAELQRDINIIYDGNWTPSEGVEHIMAAIRFYLGNG